MTRFLLSLALLVLLNVSPSFAADAPADGAARPIKVLIITGDHGHDWKATTPFLKDVLAKAKMEVDVTETPAKDLTSSNLEKYDVLLLNYKDTKAGGPDTIWSGPNRKAFAAAIEGGKGLFVYHHASSAFITDDAWSRQFEKVIAGGWRKQGFHGKRHPYTIAVKNFDHPITKDLPAKMPHPSDELYQNSLIPSDATVLVTAYSDPKKDPKNTGKDEPMVWVATYGKGRVCNNALGHDVAAMQMQGFQELLVRGVEWAATGQVKTPVSEELKTEAADAIKAGK